MPKAKNKETVKQLREKIVKSKSITVADYTGLSSNDVNTLRSTMKDSEAEMVVTKNTLIKMALSEENIDTTEAIKDFEGQTALFLAYKDPIAPIKTLFDFIKKVELPKIKAAFFDRKYITAAQVETLSKLPSREQLLTQIVGTMQAPITGFVRTLNGVQGKLVRALSAIARQKQA